MVATLTIGLANDTGTSASDNITSDATLTGTTDAGAAVAVYDLTGFILGSSPPVLLATVTADASGTWSYTPSVPDGPHAFMAQATDVAGNVRDSSPLFVTLDTASPTIQAVQRYRRERQRPHHGQPYSHWHGGARDGGDADGGHDCPRHGNG